MGGRALGALFEPARSVARVDDRRDARLLAIVLAAIVSLGTLSAIAQLAFVPGFFPSFCVIVAAMATLLFAYALSRTVHFRLAAVIAVVVCLIACFATLASNGSDATAPAFMFIPVLVASTFLPLRATATFAAASALGLVAFGVCKRADPHALWAGGAFFVIASSLSLVLARHRALLEHDRHAALAESEARYRALFEAAFEGLVVLRSGVIVDANGASGRIFGRSPGALAGTVFVELFDHESRTIVETLLDSGDGRSSELAGRSGAGSTFTVELVVQRRLQRDAAVVIVGVRDLSERRRVEARMRLMDRLSALGTLTAGVAHEISNPLTYALLMLHQLESRAHEAPDSSETIGELRDGLMRIEGVVRTLKGLVRSDEDSIVPVDVVAAVESSLRFASVQMSGRVKVVRDFRPVPAVLSNPSRLGQVFLNLLLNAVQAIPERGTGQGEIVVRVTSTDDDEVEVSVKDSGVGIAPEVLDRIFDPFFTTKPVGVGTGLGLSICHGIVMSLGGRIAVESEVGVGSIFRVTVPRAPAARLAAVPHSDDGRTSRRDLGVR
jgi:PAS domain S-box-containing protein